MKGDIRITKNFRGITLTARAAEVYNALLLNRLKLEMEKICRKNQNRPTTLSDSNNPLDNRSRTRNNMEAILLLVDFIQEFDSTLNRKMEQILVAHSLPKEIVTISMMLYRNTKGIVRLPDEDGHFQ